MADFQAALQGMQTTSKQTHVFSSLLERSRENYKVCFKYCIFLFKTSSLSKKKISLSNQLMI